MRRVFTRALYCVVLLLVVWMANTTPVFAATIPDTDVSYVGANTFLHKEAEDWKVEKTFQMLHDAGVNSIKQEFPWWEIEISAKGDFQDHKFNKLAWLKFDRIVELAEKYKISIIARLDHTPQWAQAPGNDQGAPPAKMQDFADFVKAFVQHYKGRIHYIQVWNEPNLSVEWYAGQAPSDAAKYVEMLKLSYEAAKGVDPTIRVMAAPLAITNEISSRATQEVEYLQRMYAAGAKAYFDILAANAYGQEFEPQDAPIPPTLDTPISDKARLNFRRVELQHVVMQANNDGNKAIWLNEYGWNDAPNSITKNRYWRAVTPQQRAQYTVDGIKYGHQNWPWLGTAFVWFFRQAGDIPADNQEGYFAMLNTDFSPTQTYTALKRYAVGLLPTPPQQISEPINGPQKLKPSVAPTKASTPTKAAATATAGSTIIAQAQPTIAATGTPSVDTGSITTGTSGDGGAPVGLIAAIGGIVVLVGAAFVFVGRRRTS